MTENRKSDRPAKFDLGFEEAMERIAQTNPREVAEVAKATGEADSIDALIDRFEGAGHDNGRGDKCWYARDLQGLLGYRKWEDFEGVIRRAEAACRTLAMTPPSTFERFFRPHGKTLKGGVPHGIMSFLAMPAT